MSKKTTTETKHQRAAMIMEVIKKNLKGAFGPSSSGPAKVKRP